ncbi:MAG TPA: type II secretion system secretin GspD [Geopsychrobacteraceae bacterium]|nr:type II secretion system secretin GspD [Geopsychrobacteraceae bacterium]
MVRFNRTIALLVGCLLFASCQIWAAEIQEKSGTEAGITLDFQDVELVDLIKTISELTGINFVYDEQVRGKVTIVSPKPMSIDDAYNLFHTVLNVKGFTIVPSGAVNKIVSTRSAKEENLPIEERGSTSEQFITRLIPLKNVDAAEIANTVLRPLIPKTSHVVAYAPTNTLVISDSASNTERLYQIVQELDVSGSDTDIIEIVELKYAEAEETAQVATKILVPKTPVRRARSTARNAAQNSTGQSEDGQVIAYTRTNRLILVGEQEFIDKAKSFIQQIDQKADDVRAGIHVYYLENAEADILAETLNQILTGIKAGQKTTRVATTSTVAKGVAEQETIGTVTITADNPTNALVVNANAKDYETIQGIIAKLDIKRNQVYVETLILELGMDALLDLGVSLQGAGDVGDESVVFGTSNLNTGPVGLSDLAPPIGGQSSAPSLLSQAVNGLILGGMFNPITTTDADGNSITIPALSVLINLSETDTDINVLSAPRLLTSDNEEAEIVVGSNVPIITSKGSDNAGNAVNSVERQDVALTLRFTPQVTEGNQVRLKVYQEISDVALANENVGDPNEVGPSIDKRLVRNTVLAEDGHTVVLGGLFQTNQQVRVNKVPLLGDLPLLGWLFRNKRQTETKTSLMVFITPTIIRNSEDLEKVTQRNRKNLRLFKETDGSQEVFGPLAEEVAPESFPDNEEEPEGKE